ncbi:hypothetical protein QOT17_008318 [Balamuthia mandrillaris]
MEASRGKQAYSGAGILPFAFKDGEAWFLLHKKRAGKKVGYLVDFGGAHDKEGDAALLHAYASSFTSKASSSLLLEESLCTAVREFCEETAGLLGPQHREEGEGEAATAVRVTTNEEAQKGERTQRAIAAMLHEFSTNRHHILVDNNYAPDIQHNISSFSAVPHTVDTNFPSALQHNYSSNCPQPTDVDTNSSPSNAALETAKKLWRMEGMQRGYVLYVTEIEPFVEAEELNKRFGECCVDRQCEFLWVPLRDLLDNKTEQPLFPRVAFYEKKLKQVLLEIYELQ